MKVERKSGEGETLGQLTEIGKAFHDDDLSIRREQNVMNLKPVTARSKGES